jgi:hypothetical protein
MPAALPSIHFVLTFSNGSVVHSGYNNKIFVFSKRLFSYGMESLTDLSLQYFLIFERVTTTLKSKNQHKTDGRPKIKL